MDVLTGTERSWIRSVVKPDEVDRYLRNGRDFVNEELIWRELEANREPSDSRIREIIAKSLELERLDPGETAALLNCRNGDLWQEMHSAGLSIKQKVYGRRIVFFAPLYISNYCVNNCAYCGFRRENAAVSRKRLDDDEIEAEVRTLAARGHKRLIMVYGEHPSSGADFIAHTLEVVYGTKHGGDEIRRANINAAPLGVDDLRKLSEVGIGTFQVFQETYHPATYRRVHPPETLKGDMRWRLYALHRAMEAGVDDVGMGALFGLFDHRFEVMALLLHTMDLERSFGGVGPHTISFPRLEPALNTPFVENPDHLVGDDDFMKLVTVIRLSVPYTGMILTAREPEKVRRDVIPLGITQLDAGSNIGVGCYATGEKRYEKEQFRLSDERSLEEVISDLVDQGMITSFCTAGYRCGRTGRYFMDVARSGSVHTLCMPNAILTFAEYLDDYASNETRDKGWRLIGEELSRLPGEDLRTRVKGLLERIGAGERDLYL
ncbi:MAG: [FeFe] hydrogenase H-cluster radical SAM maturase HydG [Candidatus Aegiribacteria sp. MLS_C]|nr:MAG: [FeFe] hydrogenase H-cluster radical SAM maturase HydG [Candidatus Aegiribacteria sp. MLS_C]